MKRRLELQSELETLLGSRDVYFQPPESVRMNYPAIVYELSDIGNTFADDSVYKQDIAYQVTVIDKNPDSKIVEAVSKLPKCSFNRYFASDNLNHTVFKLYY